MVNNPVDGDQGLDSVLVLLLGFEPSCRTFDSC